MQILIDHSGPNGLGDRVMQLPLYEALADRYPGARICSRASHSVAVGNPHHAEMADEAGISPDSFDLVVRADIRAIIPIMHTMPWHRGYLHVNGLPLTYGPPRAYLLPEEVDVIPLPTGASERPVIGFSGDSLVDPGRRWHLDRYRMLLRHLVWKYEAIVLEVGKGINAPYLGVGVNLIDRTSVRELMAVLHRCDLFVGNHGGLAHIAAAVGTPLLSPWGSAFAPEWFTFHTLSVLVAHDLPCKHCHWQHLRRPECRFPDPRQGVAVCLDEIGVDEMIAAAERLVEVVMSRREALAAEKRGHVAPAPLPDSRQ